MIYLKQKRQILCLLVLLALSVSALCACTDYRLPPQRPEDFTLRFLEGEQVLGVVTLDELKSLPSKKKNMVTQSSSEGTLNNEFEGVPLSDVIKLIDPAILEKYTQLTAYGADGYFSRVKMSEVLEYSNVFIMYLNHDLLMKTVDGEDGSMRIVVCNDQFGQRFTNYLVDLVFEK